MEKKKPECCTCQADFDRAIDTLTDKASYSAPDHAKKESEVRAAFGKATSDHTEHQPHVANHHATKEEKNGETC